MSASDVTAADGAIDLWVVRLRASPDDLSLLDTRERDRVERLAVADKRDQLLAAQAALRRILGTYLSLAPERVEFGYGRWGKPWLPGRPALGFNLTHSGAVTLVAVGEGLEVGVDAEDLARDRPFLRLSRRYFAPPEQEWMESVPGDRVREEFYRTWTLKEAYLKALGTGLTVPPGRFALDLSRRPAVLADPVTEPDGTGEWTFAEPETFPGYAAALCWRGGPRRIRLRDPASAGLSWVC